MRARACFQKSFSLFLSLSPSSSPHPRRGSTSRPREKQTARRKAGERGDTRNLLNHLETVSSSEEKRESSRLIFPARFSARSSVPFFFFSPRTSNASRTLFVVGHADKRGHGCTTRAIDTGPATHYITRVPSERHDVLCVCTVQCLLGANLVIERIFENSPSSDETSRGDLSGLITV